jgi:hypothetical protein
MLENLYPITGQTLSVTNGVDTFSISSIILDENDVVAGDALSDGASFIPIATVDESAGTGTLELAWPGTTRSGYATWWIWRNPAVRQSAQYAAAQASKVSARQAIILNQAPTWRVLTETATPWTDPEEADAYLIATGATGAWAGKDGQIVRRMNGVDVFTAPSVGDGVNIVDAPVKKIYTGSAWETEGSAEVRELLTAGRTYYVRTDGSDSNTGLADTSGGAFLTIQKAIDTVASLDLSTHNVTISVADGTYTGAVVIKSVVGAGTVTIQGNTSTPANVLISTTSASAVTADGVRGSWALNGLKIETTTSGHGIACIANSALSISNVHFGTVVNSHIRCDSGASVTILTGYTIAGGAQRHWLAQRGGRIFKSGAITVTITGTPAFSTAFADCQLVALMQVNGITFSGAATGARYSVTLNAVIDTIGGGASYLPGDSAGSAATGGLYA